MAEMSIARCRPGSIRSLRTLFLQELNAQFRHEAAHHRGGTANFVVYADKRQIGYGSVKDGTGRGGTVFEFYLLPPFRARAADALRGIVGVARADTFECQSNDVFFASLVSELSAEIASDTILFATGGPDGGLSSDGVFRRRRRADRVFPHEMEPVGDFVIEVAGDVVATGGFLLHYNPPFADLFMEVRRDTRRRGYGAFLIQQLIAECYLAGRVPAARTGIDNIASQRTLAKGGLRECGRMLRASTAGPSRV
jgi:GNAT superfamily N-acetyltransferase